MKKLFFGLLLIAAGAGVFFYLQNKKQTSSQNTIQKGLIVGKWKIDLYQPAKDSAQPHYQYSFLKNGTLLRSINDTAKADTLHYDWVNDTEHIWKRKADDSIINRFTIMKLSPDSLQLQTLDSTGIILLTKLK